MDEPFQEQESPKGDPGSPFAEDLAVVEQKADGIAPQGRLAGIVHWKGLLSPTPHPKVSIDLAVLVSPTVSIAHPRIDRLSLPGNGDTVTIIEFQSRIRESIDLARTTNMPGNIVAATFQSRIRESIDLAPTADIPTARAVRTFQSRIRESIDLAGIWQTRYNRQHLRFNRASANRST